MLIAAVIAVIAMGAATLVQLDDGPSANAAPQPALGSLSSVVDQVGARELWNVGVTGEGVNVAVVDTGVAPVGALAERIVAAADFSPEQADAATRYVDTNGHGTHLAGIIAGRSPGADPSDPASDDLLGVAPDAGIVSVKVADRHGDVTVAQVVSGIDWVIAHADRLDIGVLTITIDAGEQGTEAAAALDDAVARAWAAGIVVVTAAGNDGATAGGINAPARNPAVIAVGGLEATADGLVAADWSTRGDADRTPDIAAPGAHIVSLRAPGSDADVHHPEGLVDEVRFLGSGSSQSAAVAAGAAALLLSNDPTMTPDEVKAALVASAVDVGASAAAVGAGALRVDAAADLDVTGATQDLVPAGARVDVGPAVGAMLVSPDWSSSTWSSSTWSSSTWSSSTWSSSTWSSSTWSSSTWSSSTWSSSTWSSSTWSSSTWSSSTWSSSTWSSSTWSSSTWS
ncbi:MAG: S8 family serine peptidase [Ilumatobacter sp.]|uniref:S8 family serine peptidase n=1 Tax=Ilumatobacter sp. TaxID=1967498 RepID=UPI00262BD271|nr:S8 family serine peptidase [Ilumatobacter sp.]MDJ0770984.1 S8 family serine peptidase [Ilumatobacter sp.]